MEYRLRRHDGHFRWVMDTGVPRCSPDATFLGFIGSCIDITEQKETERVLQESQRRYALATAAGKVSVWDYNPATTAFYFDPTVSQLLGYGGDFPRSFDDWFDRVHPDDKEIILRLRKAVRDGSVLRGYDGDAPLPDIEYRMLRSDGEVRWLLGRGSVLRDSEGAPYQILGTATDITERKLAEQAQHLSEEKFQGLFSSNIVPLTLWNADGRIADANDAYLKLAGVTREELESGLLRWDEMTPPEFLEFDYQAVRECQERGICTPYEKEYRLRDGRRVPVLVGGGLIPGGADVGFGFAIDLTERKKAELDLIKLTARLFRLQDEERRRIARELHDTTAQNLSALMINLACLKQADSTSELRFDEVVEETIALSEQVLHEIRTLSYLLHPPSLDELGLASALEWYVDGFVKRTGIKVSLSLTENGERMSPDVENTLFRVVQESLTNIRRHSGSAEASIVLITESDCHILTIRDFGCGIINPETQGSCIETLGVGIPGMRERLRQLGGHLAIDSNGHGTSIIATVPRKRAG
jgi:PAS domain S-box-containing protein